MSHHVECPDCGAPLRIRTSYPVGETMRRLTYECLNVECGASFAASVTLDARLNMPAQPSTTVRIPLSRHVNRAHIRALLDQSQDADYQARTMPAVSGDLFEPVQTTASTTAPPTGAARAGPNPVPEPHPG